MAQWADYVLTDVSYNDDGNLIETVRRRSDTGDELGALSETLSRTSLIESLETGHTYCTAHRHEGTWERGRDVQLVYVGNGPYVRTDSAPVSSDLLEGISE